MKKAIYRLLILAILGGAGYAGYRYYKQMPTRQDNSVPTTKVMKGDVVIRAFSRGELHAIRLEPLYAPNLNGTVQVTQLAPVGAFAKAKISWLNTTIRSGWLHSKRHNWKSSRSTKISRKPK